MSQLDNKPIGEDQQNNKMVGAKHPRLRGSVYKLNLVASLIRLKPVKIALNQLEFSNRALAKDIKRLLLSAIANAENNFEMNTDQLIVSKVLVSRGGVMKRFRPRARGRMFKILKPLSFVHLFVQEKPEV